MATDDRTRTGDRGPYDGRPVYPDDRCGVKALAGPCPRCGGEGPLNPYSGVCDACDDAAEE